MPQTTNKFKEIEKSLVMIQESLNNMIEINTQAVIDARSKLDYIKYLLKCDGQE